MSMVKVLTLSSMEKVEGFSVPALVETGKSVLKNEQACYQIAVYSPQFLLDCTWHITSEIASFVKWYVVDGVPCGTTYRGGTDEYTITGSRYLPDVLREPGNMDVVLRQGVWNAFFVTISSDDGLPPGNWPINAVLKDAQGNDLCSCEYCLQVIDQNLPEHDVKYTNWFHYDSLADWYGLEIFCDSYNKILKQYIKNAVRHGMNTLLVPLFTPPLDTQPGKERRTAQLIDVEYFDNSYRIDLSRLKSFVELALSCGIKYLEFSHLFTQWGAKFAPKVEVLTAHGKQNLFGWHTAADSEEYLGFLKEFLPLLNTFVVENGLKGKCFYHISDEPSSQHIEHYKKLSGFVRQYLVDIKGMDALSDYEFYSSQITDIPVVATSHVQPFIQNNAQDYWVYYCVCQGGEYLSNRFIAMPGQRTRILGFQLYLNGIKGFLHWGHNFYYTYLSRQSVNPYAVTDCMGVYPAGDAFVVYPGEAGPVNSLRHKLMLEAFQDYSALMLLERKIGRQKTVAFLQANGLKLGFTEYPKSAVWHTVLRENINQIIAGKSVLISV